MHHRDERSPEELYGGPLQYRPLRATNAVPAAPYPVCSSLTAVVKRTCCQGAQDGLPLALGRACFNFQSLCRRSQLVFLWLGRQHEFA